MSKTLESFRKWAVNKKSVSNPTVNPWNWYKGECVSLVQQYLNQVFGVPYKARGHAKDFVPPTFKHMSPKTKLKPGDIVRYGSRFGGGYGHIEIIADNGRALGQNRHFDHKVHLEGVLSGYSDVYRPTKRFVIDDPKSPKLIKRYGKATVMVGRLYIRNSPDTKHKAAGYYDRGDSFNYDSYITTNGYTWLSYKSWSGRRRYVAEGVYDGKKNSKLFVRGGVG